MAKTQEPLLKRCRALGINPLVMGYGKVSKRTKKETRKKRSEYSLQLMEKQKLRFIYGVLERQFRLCYEKAARKSGVTGEVLLQMLELRLDNVVFRLGLAKTRDEAKQLVSHGHVMVNGKKVSISSYEVKVGDVIAFCEKSKASSSIKKLVARIEERKVPAWLECDKDNFSGKVIALPARSDIDFDVKEQLVVEYYSK